MKQVIGIETISTGAEHRDLVGYRLKVIAIIKGAAGRDHDPDALGTLITDGATIAAVGAR